MFGATDELVAATNDKFQNSTTKKENRFTTASVGLVFGSFMFNCFSPSILRTCRTSSENGQAKSMWLSFHNVLPMFGLFKQSIKMQRKTTNCCSQKPPVGLKCERIYVAVRAAEDSSFQHQTTVIFSILTTS